MSASVQPAPGQIPSYGAFSGPTVGNYGYDQPPSNPEVGQWVGQTQYPPGQFPPGGSDTSKWAPEGTQPLGSATVMPAGPNGEPNTALPVEQMDVIPGYDATLKGMSSYYSSLFF